MMLSPFAKRLGIPVGRLKSYELARAPIRYHLAYKMCVAFNVNQRWLATGERPARPCILTAEELNAVIPEKTLFSTVYDRMVGEMIDDFILNINKGVLEIEQWPSKGMIGGTWQTFQSQIFDLFSREIHDLLDHAHPYTLSAFYSRFGELISSFQKQYGDEIQRWNSGKPSPREKFLIDAEIWMRKFVMFKLEKTSTPPDDEKLSAAWDQWRVVRPKLHNHLKAGINTLTTDTRMRILGADETSISHMQTEKHFPTRLTKALNKAGLTVAAAAKKWGINRRTIEGWKQGRSKPRGINLRFVEEALASIESKA